MLDSDLAELYGVETKYLKRQVNRNRNRFPEDFMLRLTSEENRALRFQVGTLTRIFNLMFDIPTFQRLSASLFIGARAR